MLRDEEDFSDDDDLHQETVAEDGDAELLHQATLTDDPKDIEVEITQLSSAGLIDNDMKNHLVDLHKTAFKSHRFLYATVRRSGHTVQEDTSLS